MTSYETASVLISGLALVISSYSIMSAFAAKRSALAAEKQAGAAQDALATQQRASRHAEFAFWTQVFREDSEAMASTTICAEISSCVAEALRELDNNHDRPNRAVLERLRRQGLVPFEMAPLTGTGELGFRLNRSLKKANEYWRRGPNIEKVSDARLGEALGAVAGMKERIDRHKAEILQSLLEADRRTKELKDGLGR